MKRRQKVNPNVSEKGTSIYDVLEAPLVTEKATSASAFNQYAFRVPLWATKKDVQQAVQTLYKVEVESVNTLLQKGKVKRFRGIIGKRNDVKKAFVRLKEGQTLDLSSGI